MLKLFFVCLFALAGKEFVFIKYLGNGAKFFFFLAFFVRFGIFF